MKNEKKLSKTFYKVFKIHPKNNSIPFRYTFYSNKNNSSTNIISRLKTSHSSSLIHSNSIIMESMYQNKCVKKLKYVLRQRLSNSYSRDRFNNNVYKDYLHEKMKQNISRLKINSSLLNNPTLYTNKKLDNIYYNKNKSYLVNQQINNQLYSQLNIQGIDNNIYNFKNYVIQKSIIKHFLHNKKRNYSFIYEKDAKNKNYIDKIEKTAKKYLKKKIDLKAVFYLEFLKEKIITLRDNDFDLLKKRENILKKIRNLLHNIKEKAGYLCECFKLRNLLICLKEEVQIDKLPDIFTFFNKNNVNNYINILNQSFIEYDLDNNDINIPNNLYEYLKLFINENINNSKYIKYLNNTPIFANIEEFESKYKDCQFKILFNNQSYLSNSKNIVKYKLLQQNFKQKPISNNNNNNKFDFLQIRLNELKIINNELQTKYLFYNNLINNKNKKIQVRKIEEFEKQITKDKPLEESRFFFNFIKLQENKKFKTEYAYAYYLISKNVNNIYNIFPQFFLSQKNFNIKRYNECINNILNCDNVKEEIIKSDVLYLLALYETVIIRFFQIYKVTLANVKDNNEIILAKRNIFTNKNYEIIKFQKILEEYLNNRKRENILFKYNKINLIKRNNYPNYSKMNKFQ